MSDLDSLQSALSFVQTRADAVQHSVNDLLEVVTPLNAWKTLALYDSGVQGAQPIHALQAVDIL